MLLFSQIPPDGEFPVMNYRMTQEFKPPFRINALIEEAGPLKVSKSSFLIKLLLLSYSTLKYMLYYYRLKL